MLWTRKESKEKLSAHLADPATEIVELKAADVDKMQLFCV